VPYRGKVVLELVGPAPGGAERRVQRGEVLVAAHLDETQHGRRGEADKVQVAPPTAHAQSLQLQVHVAHPRLT